MSLGGMRVQEKMERFIAAAERMRLGDYVRYQSDLKRRLRDAFLQGVMRGLGAVIGFAVLGTLLIIVLKHLAERNLPVISDFLAQVITMVETRIH